MLYLNKIFGVFSNQLTSTYVNILAKKSIDVISKSKEFQENLKKNIQEWKAKEVDIIKEIEDKRTVLETQGVQLDISFIRKVTQDVSEYEQRLIDLKIKKKQYEETKKERKKLLAKRKSILDEIFKERYKFIYAVNQNLKGTVVDYEVNLKIEKQNLSKGLSELIKREMNYRTAQVPKAEFLVSNLSYQDLIKTIYKKDHNKICSLTNQAGKKMFSEEESKELINRLGTQSNIYEIERAMIKDKPIITIKKIIKKDDGATKVIERNFSKLSMGQQQSILLTILLYSKRNCPLIIDQPEDNLDSEFIYKTLVKNLKRIKEHRQVIIVTHNANIAVLGDSELILPLKSTNEKSFIIDRGGIDNPLTNKIICSILEGGEVAFRKRKEIYKL